jgi:hypothetical protein
MKTLTTCFVAVLMLLCHRYAIANAAPPPDLLNSTNPATCGGSEGTITFNGLTPNASYQVTYTQDGAVRGPVTIVATAAGQLTITGLSKGLYTNFVFDENGTINQVFTGVVLTDPIFVPSFSSIPPFCEGTTPPVLPNVSNNGITGTWSPAVVSNVATGSYTFTPSVNTCALPVTITVTVTPRVTPLFAFGTSMVICENQPVPVLPNTSLNGINGTWSPAVVDPDNSGTYVFTPSTPGCVRGTTFTLTVNPNITPSFSFGTSNTICAGQTVPTLPTTSDNGITGTWSPAVVDNQTSGTYTFTPDPGQCAPSVSYTQTVNPIVPPVFSFGSSMTICAGDAVPALPTTSDNGITGTWDPAVVSNTTSGVYTFTSSSDPCAPPVTFTVTVNPIVTPAFSFGSSGNICAGKTVPTLPTTSDNGITGTWSPAVVDDQLSGTYTFTPDPGQCAQPFTYTQTVNPVTPPVFSFGSSLTICAGDAVPTLPTTSDNGITGTWTPAVVSNTTSGVYTFTNSANPCMPAVTYTVTVNPIVTPAFSFGTSQSVCINTTPPVLPAVSTNGISGSWSPAVVDNQASGTYTFTPGPGQCANSFTFTYEVNPVPAITNTNINADTSVYDGNILPAYNFTYNNPGSDVTWTNNNPSIGLPATGTGSIPGFKAVNLTDAPVTGVITATPFINGCLGTAQTYRVTVLPLVKDIFVPNVFSPNGDGKNETLQVYGNYINSVEMHIFNQWGERIATLNGKNNGWDGKHKGAPQPVGVYVYVLKAVMMDGRKVTMKGTVTLVR